MRRLRGPLITVGAVNVSADVSWTSSTSNFNDILADTGLDRRVSGPTQRAGHTLDGVVTTRPLDMSVTVEPPIASDHSSIVVEMTFRSRVSFS